MDCAGVCQLKCPISLHCDESASEWMSQPGYQLGPEFVPEVGRLALHTGPVAGNLQPLLHEHSEFKCFFQFIDVLVRTVVNCW